MDLFLTLLAKKQNKQNKN